MDSVEITSTNSSVDLSIYGLFLASDPFVKIVMLLLVLASIWCWAIVLEKVLVLRKERLFAQKFEELFWSGGSLDTLYDETGSNPRDSERAPT